VHEVISLIIDGMMAALKEERVPDWITDDGSAFHMRTVAGKKEYL